MFKVCLQIALIAFRIAWRIFLFGLKLLCCCGCLVPKSGNRRGSERRATEVVASASGVEAREICAACTPPPSLSLSLSLSLSNDMV